MSEIGKIILTACATLIGGTILFCLTSLLQQLVFEPVIALRRNIGEISYCLQYNAWVFYMGPANVSKERYERVFEELRSVTARLRADANALTAYGLFAKIGWIPPHKDLVEATGNLVRISNSLGRQDNCLQIRDDLKTVQDLLKIDIGNPNFKREELSG